MPKFQSARSKARSLSLNSSGNHSRMSSQRWTQEEHDRLEHAICKIELKPWSAVAAFTGGRTKRQCMSHHQKCVQMIKDVNASSRWTPAECNLLQQARGDFKMGWKMVAVHVGTRDDTQCRSHYQKCNGTTSVLHRLVISDEFREWILQSAPETGGQGFTDAEADDGRGTVSRKVADSESASNNNDFCLPDPVYTESLRPVAHEAMIIDGIHPLYDEARPSLNTPGGSADVSNHPVEENFDTTMAAVSELLFGMALAQVDHQVMLDASVHGLQDTIDGIAMVDLLMEEPERLVPLDTISHHSDFVVPDYFGYPGCFTEPSGHEQSFQSPHPIYICDV